MAEQRKPSTKRSRRYYVIWLLFAVLLCLYIVGVRIGKWLVLEDSLEPSGAVVVLSGHLPFRAMEAARIYQKGWAPEVWVTRAVRPTEEAVLRRLGIRYIGEESYSAEVLKQMGVPERSIRVLNTPVLNTQGEVLLIARELRQAGARSVIIVTSKPASRRAKAVWRALVGETPRAIIRYTPEDPYDPGHWWRTTADVQAVSHELLGLLNVWTGFLVRADRTATNARGDASPSRALSGFK